MQNLLRASQALFFLLFLFLFLQTESTGRDELGYPVKYPAFLPTILYSERIHRGVISFYPGTQSGRKQILVQVSLPAWSTARTPFPLFPAEKVSK
jgi:hypothetical protein